MRSILFDLLERVVVISPLEPVIEFGSLRVPNQTHLPSVRSVFAGFQYSGADMMRGVGVDQLQDLRQIGMLDASIGTELLPPPVVGQFNDERYANMERPR